VFFPVGVILGVAVAIYVVAVKHGAVGPHLGSRRASTTPGGRQGRPRTQKGQR
jgi:hypothetical protein